MSNTRRTTPAKGRPTPPRARQSRPPAPSITFKGNEYRVAGDIGIWPYMQFCRAAESGLSLTDQHGLAALHAMMQDVIHEDDWGRFQDDMITSKIKDLDALLQLSQDAVEIIQAHLPKPRNGRPAANGRVTAEVES